MGPWDRGWKGNIRPSNEISLTSVPFVERNPYLGPILRSQLHETEFTDQKVGLGHHSFWAVSTLNKRCVNGV